MRTMSATPTSSQRVTHRAVLAIALPIMAANVSEPLIGVVDTAVIGRLPEPYYIGAVALGGVIFSVLFSAFGFLRMGTTGMTAQADGVGDRDELRAVLARALMIAGACGLALIVASPLLRRTAFAVIEGSQAVESQASAYFDIRIWAAPFSLANYAFLGWFIGLGRAGTAFALQILLNVTNMALNIVFVLGFGMAVEGVALGSLLAAMVAATGGAWAVSRELARRGGGWQWPAILAPARLRRTLRVNGDIMVRSLCLLLSFSFFTAQGAKAGDLVLAANAVLMNFLYVYSFVLDGFAHASETLVGRAAGRRDRDLFRRAAGISTLWAVAVSVALAALAILAGPLAIDGLTVNPEIRETARAYLPWVALAPVVGVWSFQLDGIFIGATESREMRNMMIVSVAIYLGAWALLTPIWGNHGLWMSLLVLFAARAATLAARLPTLDRTLFGTPGPVAAR